jgi:hypothetical protein
MFAAENFTMRRHHITLSVVKPRLNNEAVLPFPDKL